MKTVKKHWLTFAILATLVGACGDSGGGNNDGDNTGGGTTTDGKDAGATDAGGTTGTGELPKASECGAQAAGKPTDSSAAGGCYYFYCYQTEESLLSEATQGGKCANAKDVAIQCEGESVTTVAKCARDNAAVLADQKEGAFAEAVRACARRNAKLAEFSDGCLDCNVESAVCAARECIFECVSGDSVNCDKCRQTKKCTPDFYTCAGLPDPLL
jgi:hypothetical protein